MYPIAGQTAGPIGLTFFVDTHEWLGGAIGYKKIRNKKNKKNSKFFFPRATPGPLASSIYIDTYYRELCLLRVSILK